MEAEDTFHFSYAILHHLWPLKNRLRTETMKESHASIAEIEELNVSNMYKDTSLRTSIAVPTSPNPSPG